MTLGYFFGGGVSAEPAGQEFYECSPAMRTWSDQVADWTGLALADLFTVSDEGDPRFRHLARVRQVVVAVGIADVLAEAGIRPALIGGASTGGMISACLAGAVSRRDLIGLLMRMRDEPAPPDGRDQAVAIAVVPADADADWYYGDQRPGVYLGVHAGDLKEGNLRLLVLSGYTSALEELAAQAPPGAVTVVRLFNAVHSPLQQYFADFLEPYVRAMDFRAPRIPLMSCLERKVLTSAVDVEDLFRRNPVAQVSMRHVTDEMAANGTELGIVPGPSVPAGILAFPFPVVHVQQPSDIAKAAAALYELDIRIPSENRLMEVAR